MITTQSGFRNPKSMKPSSSFTIYSTDSENFKMDQTTNEFNITCNQPNLFTNVTVV